MRVNLLRVARTEAPVGWRHANPSKVRHSSLRGHLRENRVAIQAKIRPKRCSEKFHVSDLDFVILQNMDVRALGDFFDFRDELRNLLTIELVIPQNINHRPIHNRLEDPFNAVLSGVNVTSKHNDFRTHIVHFERRELQMEVA